MDVPEYIPLYFPVNPSQLSSMKTKSGRCSASLGTLMMFPRLWTINTAELGWSLVISSVSMFHVLSSIFITRNCDCSYVISAAFHAATYALLGT